MIIMEMDDDDLPSNPSAPLIFDHSAADPVNPSAPLTFDHSSAKLL